MSDLYGGMDNGFLGRFHCEFWTSVFMAAVIIAGVGNWRRKFMKYRAGTFVNVQWIGFWLERLRYSHVNAGDDELCLDWQGENNILDRFERLTRHGKHLRRKIGSFNNSVYLSEGQTADRNFALAYFMRERRRSGKRQIYEAGFYFSCLFDDHPAMIFQWCGLHLPLGNHPCRRRIFNLQQFNAYLIC